MIAPMKISSKPRLLIAVGAGCCALALLLAGVTEISAQMHRPGGGGGGGGFGGGGGGFGGGGLGGGGLRGG